MSGKLDVPRIGVIGLGLIGGSFAKALKQAGTVGRIYGFDTRAQEVRLAEKLQVIDEACDSLPDIAAKAEILVLATPVKAIEPVLRELAPHLEKSHILTDMASVKGAVAEAAVKVFGEVPANFVLGHPIAGSEKSGVAAANGDLYKDHKVILTPTADTEMNALDQVVKLWRATGAQVLMMSVPHHDEVLAATSHLPHLIAFSLVDTLAGADDNKEIFRYAAGGFRDFTRIAASDPIMWHDIFLSNRAAVLKVIDEFSADLGKLRKAIDQGDGETLMGVFTRAKAAREHFSKMLEGKAYDSNMNSQNLTYIAHQGSAVKGDIRVPGDKSMSHRSIMLGSLAEGVTEVEGFLEGEDALATLQAFRDMGVVIEGPDRGRVVIHGVGMHGLKAPHGPLYLGNSGTSMRLLAGLLSGQSFSVELTGDESLSKRPMERVAKPLREMGAVIETGDQGRPPMIIKGGSQLRGVHYDMPIASAQVKSCLLLAGLYAEGETSVVEPAPTRDHTERMLKGFGYDVAVDGSRAAVNGGGKLSATKIDVPSDISSAAFFLVAASITPGSDLTLRHVGINPTRTGVINILRLMGADIEVFNEKEVGGEPVADIRVKYAPLKGIEIPQDQVPLAIDEFPVLFIAAVNAEGETVLSGAEELRVKESDRIQVMADGLKALGVDSEVRPDGIVLRQSSIGSGSVESHGDHRIAMAFAVASLVSKSDITIKDCANVATSFPNFWELANEVGFNLRPAGEV
ncbi:bifunctional prephenate dehydrogenase/3-phosphoshikimate 1-carboxyvinyltransferase [Hahella sp. CCB-MM4]|uniref:bifunctional prephenate dehydrogenase/3-phosphoshikimate 1-carboxyvinyltransferase n=1 Tax=Hahella sp. (strain CCB-MM4) TaxID=1926491 RepID=UPI000B9AD05D|nr:bifunctional prephenate dehydrogenase/3-phosphoshikimate 1-carboxyvinyltransferase [Hahella sp. CCB-MM4]OZG72202.1 bifunctional prephenate dehydrogenase/3-phosphoshikimate 1-carboxyvinyltransferase [Hahella sp. CCB-MM4]